MMIERHANLKTFRGPLKAIGNITNSGDHENKCENLQTKTMTLPNQFHCSEDLQTPVQRVSNRSAQIRAPDTMQNLLPMPMRTSSRRSEKSFKISNDSGISDIRRHFPVRGLSIKMSSTDQNQKLTQTTDLGDSAIHFNESLSPAPTRKRHSTAFEIDHETKQSRLDYPNFSPFQSLRNNPIPSSLTMGAGVKAHPRYHKRRSGASEILQFDDNSSSIPTSTHNRLSPICPVPMPSGFPSRLPTYVSVSLPWDSAVSTNSVRTSFRSKTVQTQTSPSESQNHREKPRGRRHTGFGRQSSGTMQILHNIRKKFGNLRRAISADRLNRNSIGPEDFKSEINKPPEHQSTSSNEPIKNVHPTSNTNDQTGISHLSECKLTCHIKKKNSDGSLQIVLRRSSTAEQFGFFIARDSHGIYVSRLGSVKCAAAVWNIFHVGDRILEVQGHKCTNLEVEDVQNLIRGCELVEFRIKSNRPDSHQIPFR